MAMVQKLESWKTRRWDHIYFILYEARSRDNETSKRRGSRAGQLAAGIGLEFFQRSCLDSLGLSVFNPGFFLLSLVVLIGWPLSGGTSDAAALYESETAI